MNTSKLRVVRDAASGRYLIRYDRATFRWAYPSRALAESIVRTWQDVPNDLAANFLLTPVRVSKELGPQGKGYYVHTALANAS